MTYKNRPFMGESEELVDGALVTTSLEITVIRPTTGWNPLRLEEVWAYHELLYFLIWRDIKVRYKQTLLGAAWAIIQPFFTMVVFSIFFGRLAHIPSEGLPYPIFTYSGLVPWMFFANSLTQSSNSLVEHERVITKVYFPRLLIPLAAVLGGLVDLGIASTLLVGLLFFYGLVPSVAIFTVFFFVVLAAATAFGVGLWLSTLNIQYRDVRYIIPFLIQFWLFATPVAYPSTLVPARWRALYGLNPMAGVVEGFRWAVCGQGQVSLGLILVSVLTVATLLISGLFYFRRMEKTFADLV